jgi:hypothetical protein
MSGKNGAPAPPAESGFVHALTNGAQALITAPQSDLIERTPALTKLQAERVAADSTRRYFQSRDHTEQPFLSSNRYYEDDVRSHTAHAHLGHASERPHKAAPLANGFAVAIEAHAAAPLPRTLVCPHV